MRTTELFKARAFRLALAFSLAVSIATAGAFSLIYLQISRADVQNVGAVLVDEAAKSQGDSEERLRQALELRLTRDIRRLDYVALISPSGALIFGNVPAIPPIPFDGKAHFVQQQLLPDSSGLREPALFVARRRPDGSVLLLGRSLREAYDLQETVMRALAIALLPTILVILAIGAIFASRASRRFKRVHDAIVKIMNGDLDSRLPVANEDSDIDKVARAVNLMLDEIARLLDQLKSAGDTIAHDLRTPLAVARAKIERALDSQAGTEQLRHTMEAVLDQIEKVSMTISAILRISAVENGARERQFRELDLRLVCTQVFDLYEPLAESKSLSMSIDCGRPVPVRGDEELLREAISNLVDNAIKFTPAGGKVRIEARTIDDRPFVSVSDTGCGIPREERRKIFRRFYRGGQGADTPGHGLGLSIAETIARLHRFELTVEDNNPGARFEMRAVAKASLTVEHGHA
jgi:signal transduction histidine kinase